MNIQFIIGFVAGVLSNLIADILMDKDVGELNRNLIISAVVALFVISMWSSGHGS
ncbi:MAG: hypothetical protein V2G41_09980 [bacterium JZ-2024 1]